MPIGSSCRPATQRLLARRGPRRCRVWHAPSSTLGPALLVSHWAVNSDATVKLITGAVGYYRSR